MNSYVPLVGHHHSLDSHSYSQHGAGQAEDGINWNVVLYWGVHHTYLDLCHVPNSWRWGNPWILIADCLLNLLSLFSINFKLLRVYILEGPEQEH